MLSNVTNSHAFYKNYELILFYVVVINNTCILNSSFSWSQKIDDTNAIPWDFFFFIFFKTSVLDKNKS